MEIEMPKIIRTRLIRLGSAKRLTRGGDTGGLEPLVFTLVIG
jgi:hypothetical protein